MDETFEHQEKRSRQRVDWKAICKAALFIGVYLFIFSGGTPWSGAGAGSSVVGRPVGWAWPAVLMAHLGVCFAYMVVVAHVVFSLRIVWAMLAGVATAVALAGLNLVVFPPPAIDTGRIIAAHVVFGLFGTGLYKGLSMPRRRVDGATAPKRL